jgi:ABC-type lipoprotein release transport system permease subunit
MTVYQTLLAEDVLGKRLVTPADLARFGITPGPGEAAEVRQAIREVDSALPIVSIQTLHRQVYDRLNQQRLVARLSVMFSLLALILAAVGLYGVMAYWVSRRTHEIGIRVALGARKSDVLRLVVGRGLVMTLIGIGCGLAAALTTWNVRDFPAPKLSASACNPFLARVRISTSAWRCCVCERGGRCGRTRGGRWKGRLCRWRRATRRGRCT